MTGEDKIQFKNNGKVADWCWDSRGAYTDFGYLDEDWIPLWDCIENYFDDGDEQQIEELLVEVSFPMPVI